MARKAPPISVKDLTAALSIGREEGKKDALVATQAGGTPNEDMSGYGRDWPGTMKDQGFGDEPGKDPAEMIQLELPLDLVNQLKIMADENPEIAKAIGDELMIAHGKHFDEYGRIIQDPGFGIDPGGNPIRLPHMEQTPEEKKRNKGLHDWKYHGGPEPKLASGPDYIGDKRTYGKLDRILNPLGDFKKPTLDQLRIHAANYPKA